VVIVEQYYVDLKYNAALRLGTLKYVNHAVEM